MWKKALIKTQLFLWITQTHPRKNLYPPQIESFPRLTETHLMPKSQEDVYCSLMKIA